MKAKGIAVCYGVSLAITFSANFDWGLHTWTWSFYGYCMSCL